MSVDTVFEFYGYFFFFLYCFVGCLSMIVWTPALLGVLYACVLYFCICICPAQLSMFQIERRSRNTLITIIIITINLKAHKISTGCLKRGSNPLCCIKQSSEPTHKDIKVVLLITTLPNNQHHHKYPYTAPTKLEINLHVTQLIQLSQAHTLFSMFSKQFERLIQNQL